MKNWKLLVGFRFESSLFGSYLDRIWIQIRMKMRTRIRIQIKLVRIHNTGRDNGTDTLIFLHILGTYQWWATILENVSIKATPTHSLLKKRSNKAIQFFWSKISCLYEAINKKPKNFLRTDKATKKSWIQRILLWSDTKFRRQNFFLRWSSTNFDQNIFSYDEATQISIKNFLGTMKQHILSKFER